MLFLPNGCHCSKFTVFPGNWNQSVKAIKQQWYISYRFYDPTRPKPKQVIIKGMNHLHDIEQRREATKAIIHNELDLLQNKGYNPFTRAFMPIDAELTGMEIDPFTPFNKALLLALDRLQCTDPTRIDIRSTIKYVSAAALKLNYSSIPISQIRKKHIRNLLDTCAKVKANFTDNTFNHYRKYLSILFRELNEFDAVEFNPVQNVSKRRTIERIRETLSIDQRKAIDQHLRKKKLTRFRLYMRIFFHSGARTPELLALKGRHVNLQDQYFICTVKKGKKHREVKKTIKTIALPYWKIAMANCGADDFVFGKGLVPGKERTSPPQITRRWEVHVKKELGITADFYSLKHANTTETVDILDEKAAAAQNSHTSTAMVIKIYDTKQNQRQHNMLKSVGNSFV